MVWPSGQCIKRFTPKDNADVTDLFNVLTLFLNNVCNLKLAF